MPSLSWTRRDLPDPGAGRDFDWLGLAGATGVWLEVEAGAGRAVVRVAPVNRVGARAAGRRSGS